jgi:hypothetical protein
MWGYCIAVYGRNLGMSQFLFLPDLLIILLLQQILYSYQGSGQKEWAQ